MVLKPVECSVSGDTSVSQWFAVRGWLTNLLNTPGVMVLLLCAVAFVSWMLFRYRLRGPVRLVVLTPLLLYLLLYLPLGANLAEKGLTALVPGDRGQQADAIVVLGRGPLLRQSRIRVSEKLWRQERAPLILVSGSNDAPIIGHHLLVDGVDGKALVVEPCSRTTEENAQFSAGLLYERGVRRIILVTDPPHMLRSQLTFQSLGFEVVPHYSDQHHRHTHVRFPIEVVREYVGLVAYGIKGRYFPRTASGGNTPTMGFLPNQERLMTDGGQERYY
jgi:uncharacterized SAM-binding protein YcdF (DUF218 family)